MTRSLARLPCLALLAPLAAGITSAAAQDTTRVNEGVRIGVEYQPGLRPGLVVLPGPGLPRLAFIFAQAPSTGFSSGAYAGSRPTVSH